MKQLYWIGKYESDIQYTNYFYGSITYYGSNQDNNKAFCTNETRIATGRSNEYLCFLYDNISHLINVYKDVKFIFYDQALAHHVIRLDKKMKHYIICLNQHQIIETLNNKTYTRLWFNNIVNVPPFTLMSKESCYYKIISTFFKSYSKFVIQKNISSGGKGTFIFDSVNENEIRKQLSEYELYLVSPYIDNSYSVNIHVCVTENKQIIFPMSLQIIKNVDNKLLYSGADYIEVKRIPEIQIKLINNIAQKIADQVSAIGYRGIMGIDFVLTKEAIFFIEINPRFQGSSLPLSKALIDNGYKSIFEIHTEAFSQSASRDIIDDARHLEVPYSLVQYQNMKNSNYYAQLYNRLCQVEYCTVYADGYRPDAPSDYSANLYRALLKTHITHINKDNSLNIVENLYDNGICTFPINNQRNLISLKISLLVQGIRLSKEAKIFLSRNKNIKEATFNAIDIKIFQRLVINCPINISFVELTPFHIEYDKLNGLKLYINNIFISDVTVDVEETILDNKTTNGIPYSRIGFRTNDRVRIKHSSICCYKHNGFSCSFCQGKHKNPIELTVDDIFQVIKDYEKKVKFRHYLIGGASGYQDDEHKKIKKIIQYIRSISSKPIYLMCLPPTDTSHIQDYHSLGLNEIAFNLEVFDRNIAKEIMPGKGCIPIEQYFQAFQESTKYFGMLGNVRSMFIIGLEPKNSLLEGINKLCSIGVAPMLSALRPMPLTKMSTVITNNVNTLISLYYEAEEICSRYNLRLGPSCTQCQNNTISISNDLLKLLPS